MEFPYACFRCLSYSLHAVQLSYSSRMWLLATNRFEISSMFGNKEPVMFNTDLHVLQFLPAFPFDSSSPEPSVHLWTSSIRDYYVGVRAGVKLYCCQGYISVRFIGGRCLLLLNRPYTIGYTMRRL